jgi:pilus assembly protein CpaF
MKLPAIDSNELYRNSTRFFLKPILSLLDDQAVTEIMVNGPDHIFYESQGLICQADPTVQFPDEHSLLAAVRNIAEFSGKRVDRENHSMDGHLPDGHRVHVIIPPSSSQGITLTIRKFRESRMTLDDLVELESLSPEAAEYLNICVQLHKNILISGGTGTGKTSMANALANRISEKERIVVIEDTGELKLSQPNVVYLQAQAARPDGRGQVTIRDLFTDSLRMRPDRIIVGEVRQGEALDLVQSMLSGHEGAISTIHANTPRDALTRLETLCLMSDVDLPQTIARAQVSAAVDVVIQIQRFNDGTRRISSIVESRDLQKSQYQLPEIYSLHGQPTQLTRLKEHSTFGEQITQQQLTPLVNLTKNLFTF